MNNERKLLKSFAYCSMEEGHFQFFYFFQGEFMSSKGIFYNLLKESFKVISTVVIVDLLLHYLHISSIVVDHDYVKRAPSYIVGKYLLKW